MSDNNNDFDFEDDFLNDDNEPFDFDEEEGFPSGLGDEFESDMPEIEEEPEDRGPNRTFIFLAAIMILLFVAALAVVLFLATRNNGPTDLELTASQVVMLNMTVDAQAAGTGTQSIFIGNLTQTALAWTATPSPTQTPSETDTPTATEFHPTITPTPSQDLTELAISQLANGALTLTAMALNATATPSPAPPTEVPAVNLDLQSAFATQVAYATQQGQFDVDSFSTRVAFATQNAGGNSQAELDLRSALDATSTAINQQAGAVSTAINYIDSQLATVAVQNQALATQLAIVIPAGVQTQAALGTPGAVATINAIGTQSAFGTLSANFGSQNPAPTATAAGKLDPHFVPRLQQDQTQAVIATRDSFSTEAAQGTMSAIQTQAAIATQSSFVTPPAFSTQSALATQEGLATRQALINMALGLGGPSPTPTNNGLESVNLTATAIAGAFLTATAEAYTPGAPTAAIQAAFPTAVATKLPQTGIFEDVVNGGTNGLGVLALAVFGLVGVIVVSRRLRTVNSEADQRETRSEPKEPPDVPKQE